MRETMDQEFFERRVVSRLPIPISVGWSDGQPDVRLTLGEVSPQVYETQLPGTKVAWELNFRSHRLVAARAPPEIDRKAGGTSHDHRTVHARRI